MRHARKDYAPIQDPRGKIPADEPVFLLRAQDPIACEAVKRYSELVYNIDHKLSDLCLAWALMMEDWEPKSEPDAPDDAYPEEFCEGMSDYPGDGFGIEDVPEDEESQGRRMAREQAEAQLSSIQDLIRALQMAEQDGEVPNPLGYYDGEEPGEDDYVDEDTVREIIWEDPLSVQVRSGWHAPGPEEDVPAEYCIMLCWGGPAVRIVGDLNGYGEPESARLECQNWFTPWIDYPLTADQEADLVDYAQQFYLGT